jgi:hypothetical protein
MTREEAIVDIRDNIKPVVGGKSLDMAIKALELGSVLVKIRAEIEGIIQEETVVDNSGGEYERTISKLDPDDVFEIIDKYKGETEKA